MKYTSTLISFLFAFTMIVQAQTAYKDSTAIRFFQRTSGWVSSDGALSIQLSDGSSLWLMGDSHIDDYDTVTHTLPCLFQVRNAALHQPAGDWDWHHTQTLTGSGPGIKSYFKNSTNDQYFCWPGMGIQLKDTIFIYCGSLRNTGAGGAFGFANEGNDYWAKIKFPEMKVVGYTTLSFNGIGFGSGFVQDEKKEYVYAFGQQFGKADGAKTWAGTDLFTARFKTTDPYTWQFWDGNNWSNDINKAKAVTNQPYVAFHVVQVNNHFVLTSTELSVGCDQGKRIYTSTSNSPVGPFNAPRLVYTIDDTLQGHYPFFYTPALHPEFVNEKKEILLTYCINGYDKCVEGCVNGRTNPDHYRPKGVRVPLSMIIE